MFCEHCGQQMDDSSQFCPFCGAEVLSYESDNKKTGKLKEDSAQYQGKRQESASASSDYRNKPWYTDASGPQLEPEPSAHSGTSQQPGNYKKLIGIVAGAAAVCIAIVCVVRAVNTSHSRQSSSATYSAEITEPEEHISRVYTEPEGVISAAEPSIEESSIVSEENTEEIPQQENETADRYTVVNTDYLTLRSSSNTGSNAVRKLSPGETVEILEYNCNGFWKVRAGTDIGYVLPSYLQAADGTNIPVAAGVRIASQTLTMWDHPGNTRDVIATIPAGTELEFYDIAQSGCSLIRYNGRFGYVDGQLLATREAYNSSGNANQTIGNWYDGLSTGRYRVYRTDYLTVRKTENITADEIGKLYEGDVVICVMAEEGEQKPYGRGIYNGFAKIIYNNGFGYVLPSYLEHVDGDSFTWEYSGDWRSQDEIVYGWPSESAEVFGQLNNEMIYTYGYNTDRKFILIHSQYGFGYIKDFGDGRYSMH